MRITFVNDSIGFGGAAKVMMVIVQGLKAKGHQLSVINLNTRNTSICQNIDGIQVETANIEYKSGFMTNYRHVAFTIQAAKKLHSDILIGFKGNNNFCVSLAGKILGIPSIISERADPFTTFRNLHFLTKIKLFFINRANGAVFQTEGASRFYSKHLQKEGCIIPNPILLNHKIPNISYDNMPKSVVFLGRLADSQKRLDIMVKSFACFHSTHPDYHLYVYGVGEDEKKLKAYIQSTKMESYITLMGLSKNSLEDMSKHGMFIITSDFEGISNALLEAMAIGLPVVSTNHSPGGASLLISDHENGLLTPTGDYNAFASAMSQFADDPQLAKKCGMNAKKVLERFEVNKIVNMWNDYIMKFVKE